MTAGENVTATYLAVISTARERSHAVINRPRKGFLGVRRFLASLRNDSGRMGSCPSPYRERRDFSLPLEMTENNVSSISPTDKLGISHTALSL